MILLKRIFFDLQRFGPSPIAGDYFGELMRPSLTEHWEHGMQTVPDVVSQLYDVQTSEQAFEEDQGVGGFGSFDKFNGMMTYDGFNLLPKTVYRHEEFVKGFIIGRKEYDDNNFNLMTNRARALGIAAGRTRQEHGVSLFNNAFTTFQTSDGVALCGNHGANNVNVSNLPLNAANVSAARLVMQNFRDDRGKKLGINADLLIVPPDLEETGFEIIKSSGQVDTANNNRNFHEGRYKMLVWNELSSATAWFLADSVMMKLFLKWYDRVKPEFALESSDSNTLQAAYRGYMRYSYGASHWCWLYGSTGV